MTSIHQTVAVSNTVENGMDVDRDVVVEKSTTTTIIRELPDKRFTVGYVWSADMLAHRNLFDDGKETDEDENPHPEVPGRIEAIYRAFAANGLLRQMKQLPIRPVRREEVMLVHSVDLWEKVLAIQAMTDQQIIASKAYYEGLSLYINNSSTYAAQLSCGGVIETCLAVANGEVEKGFAIVRPPGHHAEPDEHMGFCFFNNACVAARTVQAQTSLKKILILDWDVHHGNGSQSAFYDDPSVLYISLHRYENGNFYPCGDAGAIEKCGEDEGAGFNVNIGWPDKGMGDAEYLHAFQRVVMPIAMAFNPDLVIISAGFDAAKGDKLGECEVTPDGYAHMTHMLASLAGGKLVVALEGGYNLEAISNSALAVARILLGEAPPRMQLLRPRANATLTVWQVAKEQKQYWDVLDVPACEPAHEYEEITVGIPEILMAHRQDYLARHVHMLQIPINIDLFPHIHAAEAWCTKDIFDKDKDTLIVLVHEFGELRGEPLTPLSLNLHLEKTYLIDFTRDILKWVVEEGYPLMDINLTERLFARQTTQTPEDLKRNLVTYLWDNYIHLCPAKQVVFLGHGAGAAPIIETLAKRSVSVMHKVKHVIQIAPRTTIPRAPADPPTLRKWYQKNSTVFLSAKHPFILDGKNKPSHGKLYIINEDKPILLLKKCMDLIKRKIQANFAD